MFGALLGFAGALIGGKRTSRSTKNTNAAMLRANRETNSLNEAINKRTLAWDRDKTNITVRENRRAQDINVREARRAQDLTIAESRRAQAATIAEARRAERVSIAENRRAQRLSQESDNTRIQRAVSDAKKAGINPLTALGAAGASSQAFSSPVFSAPVLSGAGLSGAGVSGVSLPGAPGQIGAVAPPPLSIDRSGEMLGGAVNTLFNSIDPLDRQRERLELKLMQAELEQRQRQTEVVRDRDFGYSIPHAANYSGTDYRSSRENGGGPVRSGDGLWIAGTSVDKDTRWSDAEKIEERYGDVASAAYGIAVAGADFINTKRPFRRAFDEIKNPAPRSVAAKLKNWWTGKSSASKPIRPKLRPTYGNPEAYSWFE